MERMNCDVFVADGSIFGTDNTVSITGNFYVGNNCSVHSIIDAEGEVFVGDNSYVDYISSKSNVIIGDFSEIIYIESKKNISLGICSTASEVIAGKDIVLGYRSNISNITAQGDLCQGKRFNPFAFLKKLWLDFKL